MINLDLLEDGIEGVCGFYPQNFDY